MKARTWTWTSTGAAAVSARYVLSGTNCYASSLGNLTEENWQPWSGTGISGTRFSGSNSRVLGQAYYGCTIVATYTARSATGGVVASTVRVSFRNAGISATPPDSTPLYYCNGVVQHEPCTGSGGSNNPVSTSPTTPIASCLYVAPRPGCTYVQGPSYNPNTNCGLVEVCSGSSTPVTDTPGTTLNLTPSSVPSGSLYSLYASCPSSGGSASMKIEYQSNGQYVSRGCMNVTSYTTSALGAGQEIGTAPGSLVPQTYPTSVGANNYRLTCYSGLSCGGNVTATKNSVLTVTSSGSSGGAGGTGGPTISSFAFAPSSITTTCTSVASWDTINAAYVRISCVGPGALAWSGSTYLPSNGSKNVNGTTAYVGTTYCTITPMSPTGVAGANQSFTWTVTNGTGGTTSSCPSGTVPLTVLGMSKCGPIGGVCPAGTQMVGLLTSTPTCDPSTGSGSGSGTGGSGTGSGTTTVINPTDSSTCNHTDGKTYRAGAVRCQGDTKQIRCQLGSGTQIGTVRSFNHCVEYTGGVQTSNPDGAWVRSENNTIYSYELYPADPALAGKEGGSYKKIWNSGTKQFSGWVFVECRAGFHSEGSPENCVSSVKSCTTASGSGRQEYKNGSWGACVVDTCTAGNVMVYGTCRPARKSCTPTNPLPSTHPRGSSVATGYKSIVSPITTDLEQYLYEGTCNVECKSGYEAATLYEHPDYPSGFPTGDASSPGSSISSSLTYCRAVSQEATGDLTIPPIVTTDYVVSWSTDTGGISKTVSCKVKPGKSTCDLTASWSSNKATSGSLTRNGASVGTGGTSGSYRFTIQANTTDTLVLTLQPGNVRLTNTVIAECETGIWNGSVCTTSGGASGGIASGSISGGRCTVSIGMSSCATSVSWTSSNASTVSVTKKDEVSPSQLLSSEKNGATTITGLTPLVSGRQVILQVQPGPTGPVQYSVDLIAECATGSAWNGSTCAPTTGGGTVATLSVNYSPSSGGSSNKCIIPNGQGTCNVTVGWTTANASAGVTLDGVSVPGVSGKIFGLIPTVPQSFTLVAQPGNVTRSGTVYAECLPESTYVGGVCVATTGGGGGTTASCSASLSSTDFFQTQEVSATISSSGVTTVEQSPNGGVTYLPFTTRNGTQTFPAMYFTPGSYTILLRGQIAGGGTVSCTPPEVRFTVKP